MSQQFCNRQVEIPDTPLGLTGTANTKGKMFLITTSTMLLSKISLGSRFFKKLVNSRFSNVNAAIFTTKHIQSLAGKMLLKHTMMQGKETLKCLSAHSVVDGKIAKILRNKCEILCKAAFMLASWCQTYIACHQKPRIPALKLQSSPFLPNYLTTPAMTTASQMRWGSLAKPFPSGAQRRRTV